MLVGSCHTLAAWLRGAPWLDTYTRSPPPHATRSGMLHGQGSIATSIRYPTFAHPPIARTAASAILHGQKRLGEKRKKKENLDGSSVWASLAFGSSAGCSCCADEDCWPPAAALSASKAALASIAANSALSAAQRLGVPRVPRLPPRRPPSPPLPPARHPRAWCVRHLPPVQPPARHTPISFMLNRVEGTTRRGTRGGHTSPLSRTRLSGEGRGAGPSVAKWVASSDFRQLTVLPPG